MIFRTSALFAFVCIISICSAAPSTTPASSDADGTTAGIKAPDASANLNVNRAIGFRLSDSDDIGTVIAARNGGPVMVESDEITIVQRPGAKITRRIETETDNIFINGVKVQRKDLALMDADNEDDEVEYEEDREYVQIIERPPRKHRKSHSKRKHGGASAGERRQDEMERQAQLQQIQLGNLKTQVLNQQMAVQKVAVRPPEKKSLLDKVL